MGTITTGVGLISGLDYQSMVDQLIEVEAGPRDLLLERIATIDAQRTAYTEISARITALLSRITTLSKPGTFMSSLANSSNADVLMATAGAGAVMGSFSFTVRALASTHQAVSRGFQSRTTNLNNGTRPLVIESAGARVNNATRLDELNGYAGVRRGSFKISNEGEEATINIAEALTLGEVVDQINNAGINVAARVADDRIVLEDASGNNGTLRVQEVAGGHAAADLGFKPGSTYGQGTIEGAQVIYLSEGSPLTALNDGLGVRTSAGGGDFTITVGPAGQERDIEVDLSDVLKHDTRLERLNHGQGVRLGTVRITSRDRVMREVDLSGADTIQDVVTAIEGAFEDGRVRVTLAEGHLLISDSTDITGLDEEQTTAFKIEDVSGHAAKDLGIDSSNESGRITGSDVIHMDSLADVLGAINLATGNMGADKQPLVTATIDPDGYGIQLQNRAGNGPMILRLPEENASQALADLGLAEGTYYDAGGGAVATGQRVVGGVDTVLLKTLNGGAGFEAGAIRIEMGGSTVDVDLSGAETLEDVVQRINAEAESNGLAFEAGYDRTGTRLTLSSFDGVTSIAVSDVGEGDFAAATGLSAAAGPEVRSENLQRQYVNENTLLEDLNGGRGVSKGRFKITGTNGANATIDVSAARTVGDVLDEINLSNIGVTARINDTGDGILLADESGGAVSMEVEEEGGSTARDLNLLGTAGDDGEIDGSYEFHFDIGGSETLETLANRISEESTLASATILNDGTGIAPYRLNITARVSGSAGDLIIDDTGTDLGITTLSQAQDARIFFGGNAQTGMLLTSSDNTFEDVVEGLTLTANSVSDEPVTVTVDRDLEALIKAIKGLVDDYNGAMGRIREAGDYDEETETRGVLMGESTLYSVEQRLYKLFSGSISSGTQFDRFSDLGVKTVSGGRLSFDEEKFREAYALDPQGVTDFFTAAEVGVAHVLKEQVEAITDSADGLIARRDDSLGDQKEILQERVETLNERLERKRMRLLRDFQAMESALSMMQSQQNALSSLASMAGGGLTSLYNSGA